MPYINYGILAWGSAIQTQLNRILLQQKNTLRIIFQTHFRSHTDTLFLNNNLLKVNDIFLFQLGQFMYKLKKSNLPLFLLICSARTIQYMVILPDNIIIFIYHLLEQSSPKTHLFSPDLLTGIPYLMKLKTPLVSTPLNVNLRNI